MKLIKLLFIIFIKFYKFFISPLLGNNCRFYPSCSTYAVECFEKLPLHKAMWYSMKRIIRCHPYSRGGVDPIPSLK